MSDPFAVSHGNTTKGRRRSGPPNPLDFDWVSDNKKRTAKRRVKDGTVQQVGENEWIVTGIPTLSDHYDEYEVTRYETIDGKRRHRCSCSNHMGGNMRRTCTHQIAVMLDTFERYERGETWTGEQSTERPTAAEEPASSNGSSTAISNLIASAPSVDGSTASSPPKRKKRRRRNAAPDSAKSPSPTSENVTPSSPPSTTGGQKDANAVPASTVPGSWPSWVQTFRPLQVQAAREIVEAFKEHDLVFFDGPTGSGKSLIAAMVAQFLQEPALVCTADKALQDQYVKDFAEVGAATIKGRKNYLPQIPSMTDSFGQTLDVTCDDCDYAAGKGCTFCPEPDECSYRTAKDQASKSPLAVLNYAYLLNEANGARPTFTERPLVICDECDVLEDQLLSYAEVVYSQRLRQDLDLGQPSKLEDDTGDSYLIWLESVARKIEWARENIDPKLKGVRRRRRQKFLTNKLQETEMLIHSMTESEDQNWVLTGYRKDRRRGPKQGPMVFKPVRVGEYGRRSLFRHGRKWLLMSATIVSPDELAESLGWEDSYGFVQAPMPFDVERRRIHFIPVAKVTRATKHEALPQIVEGVKRIVEQWPDDRAIVHTVSYELTKMVEEALRRTTNRPVFTYAGSSEKESTIREFESTPGAILVGPSIGRGTDFKGDKARVNIICKMPFMSLGDKQVNARLYSKGGQLWYSTKAIRELVQACGRTTRSESDWSVTYILDAGVGRQIRENRRLFPGWWTEALTTAIKPSQLLEGRPLPRPNL